MIGVLRGLGTTLKTMLRRPVTVQYPDERLPVSPRRRGFPGLLWDEQVGESRCTGCGMCARQCPTQCITVTMRDNPLHKEGRSPRRKIVDVFELDVGLCMQCAICVEVCPFEAIEMTKQCSLPSPERRSLVLVRDGRSGLKRKASP